MKSIMDKLENRAKGINQKYYKWILKIHESMDMDKIDLSIFDYFKASKTPVDTNISYEEAKVNSDIWHNKKNERTKKSQYKLDLNNLTAKQHKLVQQIDDMFFVKVTKEDLNTEGYLMKNCITEYYFEDDEKGNYVYSLRDLNNKPHVDIQISKKQIVQIKAKANTKVKDKYSNYIVKWAIHNNYFFYRTDGLNISKQNVFLLKEKELINDKIFLNCMISSGELEEVKKIISGAGNTKEDLERHCELAIESGQYNVFMYFLDFGLNNFRKYLECACQSNNKKIIDFILNKNWIKNFDEALIRSAMYNHTDLVKLFVELGANKYTEAMCDALENNNVELINFFLQKDINVNVIMNAAAVVNNKEIIDLMIQRGANEFNDPMVSAAGNGHFDLVKFFLSKGAKSLSDSLSEAALNGYLEIVKFMLEKGAKNIIGAIERSACKEDTINVFEYFIQTQNIDSKIIGEILVRSIDYMNKLNSTEKKYIDMYIKYYGMDSFLKSFTSDNLYLNDDKLDNVLDYIKVDKTLIIKYAEENNNEHLIEKLKNHDRIN